MATTTRIDTSIMAVAHFQLPVDFWGPLGGKEARRWAGVSLPHWRCWTFSLRLPRDLAAVWFLRQRCQQALDLDGFLDGTTTNAIRTMRNKIDAALGWPVNPTTADPLEQEFRKAIVANASDLANWTAYADWLQEGNDERGLTMARWLSPKVWSRKAAKEERDRKIWEEVQRSRNH